MNHLIQRAAASVANDSRARRVLLEHQAKQLGESLRLRRGVEGLRTDKHFRNMLAIQLGGQRRAAELLGPAWRGMKRAGSPSMPVWTRRDGGIDPDTLQEVENLPGSIFTFDAIVTTNRADRDGDVLLPDGAIVDPAMPLLWQHNPSLPIGKLVGILEQSKRRLSARFALADLDLARDAATLIEFGALRISHGFAPIEYAPLDITDDDDEDKEAMLLEGGEGKRSGWRITKYEIMETSLVSIPSNVDAIITAYSRGKLHSPMARKWARSLMRRKAA